jgi:hypothetical protein
MKYYMIPFTSFQTKPSYKIWFASWSAAQPTVYWSETQPNIDPDWKSTWVVGVSQVGDSPQDATILGAGAMEVGTGGKDLPPPPLQLAPSDAGIPGFQTAFAAWLERRGA